VARARLLKAEAALAAKNYADAAILYGQIDATALPATARPDILYKQALDPASGRQPGGGTKAISLFLKAYPSEERAPAALAQRAMLRQESRDFEGALSDFTQLAQNYPKAAERELALQQKALLLGNSSEMPRWTRPSGSCCAITRRARPPHRRTTGEGGSPSRPRITRGRSPSWPVRARRTRNSSANGRVCGSFSAITISGCTRDRTRDGCDQTDAHPPRGGPLAGTEIARVG